MDNMDIEEDENTENSYGEEAMLIRKLDCKNVKCRKFLTRSFRKLNKLVNKKRNYTYSSIHIDLHNLMRTLLILSSSTQRSSNLTLNSKCLKRGPLRLNLTLISLLLIENASKQK